MADQKEFEVMVDATDDIEELKVIYAEYEKHIGSKIKRVDSINKEIESLKVEKKELMKHLVYRDISYLIRDKISVIVLGIKDGE